MFAFAVVLLKIQANQDTANVVLQVVEKTREKVKERLPGYTSLRRNMDVLVEAIRAAIDPNCKEFFY